MRNPGVTRHVRFMVVLAFMVFGSFDAWVPKTVRAVRGDPALAAQPGTERSLVVATAAGGGELEADGSHKRWIGGMARRVDAIRGVRDRGLPTVLVDAGDFLGQPKDPCREERTRLLLDLMNGAGYDAVTPGERELFQGISGLAALREGAPGLAFVSANLLDLSGRRVLPADTVIVRDGVRFGITGVTDSTLLAFFRSRGQVVVSDFCFGPAKEALRETVDGLRPRCDVLVALLHFRPGEIVELVEGVPGIDVIVSGHLPGSTPGHYDLHGIPMVRAGQRGECLGVVEIAKGGADAGWGGDLVCLGSEAPPDSAAAARIHAFEGACRERH